MSENLSPFEHRVLRRLEAVTQAINTLSEAVYELNRTLLEKPTQARIDHWA